MKKVLLLLCLFALSCEKDDVSAINYDLIYGKWELVFMGPANDNVTTLTLNRDHTFIRYMYRIDGSGDIYITQTGTFEVERDTLFSYNKTRYSERPSNTEGIMEIVEFTSKQEIMLLNQKELRLPNSLGEPNYTKYKRITN